MNAPKATCDFETRSARNLKKHGPWRYSIDKSTEILCLAYRLPDWEDGRTEVWHPAICGVPERVEAGLSELLEWIDAGGLVEAHNVWFEYCIWINILVSRHGWPAVAMSQWRCSASKAAARALPRSLEDATSALHLSVGKDSDGHKVMMKMSKPRKPRKKEREAWAANATPPTTLWHESPELHERLVAYCRQDVLAEVALSDALSDLSPDETGMFLLDLAINQRGFQIDREAVTTALRLIHREGILLNAELAELTGGKVRRATQRDRLIRWLQGEGLDIDNTQKGTLDDLLTTDRDACPPSTLRPLEILRTLGRSSTAKYSSMRDWMGRDGRVRGGLLYHGATTGRWAGKGVQPHNFARGTLGKVDVEELWALLKRGIRDEIMAVYPSVMEALSHGLRGAIIAGKGQQLYVADYVAIEARVLLWLADDEESLDIFRSGRDIYLEMAESIYHRPCTKADVQERQLAKIAVLGLGYQMGAVRFVEACAGFGVDIDEVFAQEIVTAYRSRFYLVKQLWTDMEQAACDALHKDNENEEVSCGCVSWRLDGGFLLCRLPSGRDLSYPFPQLKARKTPWGEMKTQLTFMGFNDKTHQWERQSTYGGKLVENVVQAISRDILAEALLRCEHSLYKPILSVHDENVTEAPAGRGSLDEFDRLMTQAPTWAPDCPIAVESWTGQQYHK